MLICVVSPVAKAGIRTLVASGFAFDTLLSADATAAVANAMRCLAAALALCVTTAAQETNI